MAEKGEHSWKLYNFHQTAQPPGAPLRQGSARNAQSRFETKTGIPLSGLQGTR